MYDLMKSPAVSGVQSYQQLCVSMKHKEKRVADVNCISGIFAGFMS